MLNLRLYRAAWLIAGVGLIVALLTLRDAQELPQSDLPPSFDTGAALDLAQEIGGVARTRPPGSPGNERVADLVRRSLRTIPGGQERVREQTFTARDSRGRLVRMRNIYRALPAGAAGIRGGILVVAPRDTPELVAGGTSSTAILIQVARTRATTVRRRPLIVLSTDGSSLGNAGMQWFLSRFSDFPIAAAVVIDAPGEGRGGGIDLWTGSRTAAAALDLLPAAAAAVRRAGGDPRDEIDAGQVPRRAVAQSFGDQAPLIAAGIPAITIANRRDSPLRLDLSPTAQRIRLAGTVTEELLGTLDAAEEIDPPRTAMSVAGRILDPAALRTVVLLLLLPAIVVAVDATSRVRRARLPMSAGLGAAGRRIAAVLAAVLVAYLASVLGALPEAAAGAPPLPADVPFGITPAFAILVAIGAGAGAWAGLRRRREAPRETEVVAAVLLIVVAGLVAWAVNPFAAALLLPAVHAAALSLGASRPWHGAGLIGLVALSALPAVLVLGPALDRGPLFNLWYLLETAASGSRGVLAPVIAGVAGACIWAIASALISGWQPRPALSVAPRPQRRRRRRRGRRRVRW